MKINPLRQTNFKGYDARPLKGFLMSSNCRGIAEEMRAIGKIEGFKIFSVVNNDFQYKCNENIPDYDISPTGLWAQDYWSIVKNKLFSFEDNSITKAIREFFELEPDFTQQIDRRSPKFKELNQSLFDNQKRISSKKTKEEIFPLINKSQTILNEINKAQQETHIPGGNFFIAKNKFGEEIIIVGEDSTRQYTTDEINCMYRTDGIITLPQMDFHIDLFIRPLNNGKVLVADDNLTLKYLIKGLKNLKKHIESLPIKERRKYSKIFAKLYVETENFKKNIDANKLAVTNEVTQVLESNGFEAIRIPARIYEYCNETNGDDFLKHKCNYLNANVLINNQGKLVYITNKSNFDKEIGITPEIAKEIDFSFEKNFVDIMSKYIDKNHFYFVNGEDNYIAEEMLPEFFGGIHCACAEVPKNLK